MTTTSSVLVDTSGWAEPLMGNSADHEQMERYYRALIAGKRQVVTTNYILSELAALLTVRSRFTRPELLAIINGIKRITHLNLVHIDPIWTRRPGRCWSSRATRSGRWSMPPVLSSCAV